MQDRNGGEDNGPLLVWLATRPASPRAEQESGLVLCLRQALYIKGRREGEKKKGRRKGEMDAAAIIYCELKSRTNGARQE